MEKFGLFDLIEKFGSTAAGKNEPAAKPSFDKAVSAKEISGTPPQLTMNAKMREFISRHDETVKEILKAEAKKKKRRKTVKPSFEVSVAPKKRGRPKKSENIAP